MTTDDAAHHIGVVKLADLKLLFPRQTDWITLAGRVAQRREGNWIGADYALRQLTHIEMIMEVGGATQDMIEQLMVTAQTDGGSPLFSSPISRHLAARRQRGWDAEAAENPRPPLLDYPNGLPSPHFRGGPDIEERQALRREATAMFAQALHKWEVSVGR